MTDQHHPLTDDLCYTVCEDWPPEDDVEKDNMRSAADWQLEQVVEWIRSHPWAGSDCPFYDFEAEEERSRLIDDLKKAMRPQEDN